MTGGHHPRRPVQRRPEVVVAASLGLTGGDPHAHRQAQPPLRLHRGVDRGAGRAERRAHPVTGVLEQPTAMGLDRRPQHLVVRGQRRPHRLGIGLPPARRTLDVGEQERHRPRRPSHGPQTNASVRRSIAPVRPPIPKYRRRCTTRRISELVRWRRLALRSGFGGSRHRARDGRTGARSACSPSRERWLCISLRWRENIARYAACVVVAIVDVAHVPRLVTAAHARPIGSAPKDFISPERHVNAVPQACRARR